MGYVSIPHDHVTMGRKDSAFRARKPKGIPFDVTFVAKYKWLKLIEEMYMGLNSKGKEKCFQFTREPRETLLA